MAQYTSSGAALLTLIKDKRQVNHTTVLYCTSLHGKECPRQNMTRPHKTALHMHGTAQHSMARP